MWAAVCQMTRCSGSGIAVLWEMGDVSSTHQLPKLSGIYLTDFQLGSM